MSFADAEEFSIMWKHNINYLTEKIDATFSRFVMHGKYEATASNWLA